MALWSSLKEPQLPVPPHVVRAKSRLMQALVTELAAVVGRWRVIDRRSTIFSRPCRRRRGPDAAVGEHGVTVPTLWARLGDAPGRWQSFRHLQAQAGWCP